MSSSPKFVSSLMSQKDAEHVDPQRWPSTSTLRRPSRGSTWCRPRLSAWPWRKQETLPTHLGPHVKQDVLNGKVWYPTTSSKIVYPIASYSTSSKLDRKLGDFRTQLQWYREAEDIPGVSGWVLGRWEGSTVGSGSSGAISLPKQNWVWYPKLGSAMVNSPEVYEIR